MAIGDRIRKRREKRRRENEEFSQTMINLYGPDWQERVNPKLIRRQYDANKDLFINSASYKNAVRVQPEERKPRLVSKPAGSAAPVPKIQTQPLNLPSKAHMDAVQQGFRDEQSMRYWLNQANAFAKDNDLDAFKNIGEVRDFQRKVGVSADGRFGSNTALAANKWIADQGNPDDAITKIDEVIVTAPRLNKPSRSGNDTITQKVDSLYSNGFSYNPDSDNDSIPDEQQTNYSSYLLPIGGAVAGGMLAVAAARYKKNRSLLRPDPNPAKKTDWAWIPRDSRRVKIKKLKRYVDSVRYNVNAFSRELAKKLLREKRLRQVEPIQSSPAKRGFWRRLKPGKGTAVGLGLTFLPEIIDYVSGGSESVKRFFFGNDKPGRTQLRNGGKMNISRFQNGGKTDIPKYNFSNGPGAGPQMNQGAGYVTSNGPGMSPIMAPDMDATRGPGVSPDISVIKYNQQGGQVDGQQEFLQFLVQVFQPQSENQLKQIIQNIGKEGLMQLQQAFQQGADPIQIRSELGLDGGVQSARNGGKVCPEGMRLVFKKGGCLCQQKGGETPKRFGNKKPLQKRNINANDTIHVNGKPYDLTRRGTTGYPKLTNDKYRKLSDEDKNRVDSKDHASGRSAENIHGGCKGMKMCNGGKSKKSRFCGGGKAKFANGGQMGGEYLTNPGNRSVVDSFVGRPSTMRCGGKAKKRLAKKRK